MSDIESRGTDSFDWGAIHRLVYAGRLREWS